MTECKTPVTEWDFSGQDLANAYLYESTLTDADLTATNLDNANLYQSTLTNARLAGAVVTGTGFWDTTSRGFTKEQLYSTQSYQNKNLRGIGFGSDDLTGWNFVGQDLANASLAMSNLTNANLAGANLTSVRMSSKLGAANLTGANLTGANLKNAYLEATILQSTIFDAGTIYNQWTLFPPGFDPAAAGLTYMPSVSGDFDADDTFDAADVDMLSAVMVLGSSSWWLPKAIFDLTGNGWIDEDDHRMWVNGLAHTWYGDADLNGEFHSGDFVQVFQAGKYETGEPAGWSEGDWDADGLFDSNDFIIAFQDGGYEQGPRTDVAAVPEPSTAALMLAAACLLVSRMRADRRWALLLALSLAPSCTVHADIYRWDNGQVIPGTEGITPGPGVQLDHRQLEYARLRDLDLTGSNFGSSNLTNASLESSTLTNADLTGANLTSTNLDSSALTNADFTGAVVTGTRFRGTTSHGFTAAQLYSTQSYQAKDLSGIRLGGNDLSGWDFSGQNLANAHLEADLSSADFSEADLTGVLFRLKLGANLTNANLRGANLKRAHLGITPLTNANLTGAKLTGAYISGLTKEQLYSTASYRQKHLQGIRINRDLTGWDFSGQNLTNAQLDFSTMTEANFSGANLQNAYLEVVTGLASAMFDANTAYNQCTVFPGEFDPIAAGLTLLVLPGDLDGNGELDAADVDLLTELTQTDFQFSPWLLDCNDARIDHHTWVKDLKHTWFGDADLNGEFDSSDFVQVFQAGKYEQGWLDEWGTIHNGAGWSEGDWNADGLFDSDDFITAFQDGGYEQGPRPDAAAVPESGGWMMLLTGFVLWLFGFRIHRAVS